MKCKIFGAYRVVFSVQFDTESVHVQYLDDSINGAVPFVRCISMTFKEWKELSEYL